MVNLAKTEIKLTMTYHIAQQAIRKNDLSGIWLMLMVRDDHGTVAK